jgi:hypothetical protein
MPTNTWDPTIPSPIALSRAVANGSLTSDEALSIFETGGRGALTSSPLHTLQRLIQERLTRNYDLQNVRVEIDRDIRNDSYRLNARYLQPMGMSLEISDLAFRDMRDSPSAFLDSILQQVEGYVRQGQRTTNTRVARPQPNPALVPGEFTGLKIPQPPPPKSRVERLLADDIFEECA